MRPRVISFRVLDCLLEGETVVVLLSPHFCDCQCPDEIWRNYYLEVCQIKHGKKDIRLHKYENHDHSQAEYIRN